MTGSGGTEVVDAAGLPHWLQQLARTATSIEPADLVRHMPPADVQPRESAVLVLFSDGQDGPSVLLSQRAADLRRHAGQVAFPGGAVDATDETHVLAALREAEEEVGLDPTSVRVVSQLPAVFIPPSGFLVTPVIAWWSEPHTVGPVDAAEVALVVNVPLAALTDPANRFVVKHPLGYSSPGFEAGGLFVWGFTALLLDRLLELGGWAQPWDETVAREFPPDFAGRPPWAAPSAPDAG
jgi:8-oxo-dGTP pyrophosphatase MutT (NUDIX family)